MYAVFATGGKQYRVSQGDIIFVEKLDVTEGETLTFGALMTSDNGNIRIGRPTVENALITAKSLGMVKGEKIHIYKYKSKKNHHKRMGHRQKHTRLEIVAIAP